MTHGQYKTRLYAIWRNMRERCNNPHKQFAAWHGRGIKVCTEWDDFAVFREWALSHGYSEGLSIDRIDNDKGYTPSNCRWVTMKEQNANRRCIIMASHRKAAKGASRTICIQISVSPTEHKSLVTAANNDGRSLRQYVKWNALKAANYEIK